MIYLNVMAFQAHHRNPLAQNLLLTPVVVVVVVRLELKLFLQHKHFEQQVLMQVVAKAPELVLIAMAAVKVLIEAIVEQQDASVVLVAVAVEVVVAAEACLVCYEGVVLGADEALV